MGAKEEIDRHTIEIEKLCIELIKSGDSDERSLIEE
jgi:hypothetical protein